MTILRRGELIDDGGILHRLGEAGTSEYRRRWEEEMEQRYRDEVQITREFMRRNELLTKRLIERIENLA